MRVMASPCDIPEQGGSPHEQLHAHAQPRGHDRRPRVDESTPAHGEVDRDRLDKMIRGLESDMLVEREMSLASLQFKLRTGILLLHEVALRKDLMAALLKWFNWDDFTQGPDVLTLLLHFAEVGVVVGGNVIMTV